MQYDCGMSPVKYLRFLCLSALLLIQACATNPVSQAPQDTDSDSLINETIDSELADIPSSADPFLRARILADMLYEASLALDDNRLMLPAGDNAYDRYQEVLSFQPDNQVALQGMEEIVDRYVTMANQAIEIGQFDSAEDYLDRAAFIHPDKENITEAWQFLRREQSINREYFSLDPDELSAQSLLIMSQLGSIGEMVRNYDATFLITARNDAEARWIYRIMREAVGGYRLRGNIALGSQPTIQVNIPQS